MKICPSCRRTYDDDGLNFCLEDGSVLTFSSLDSAAPTIAMHQPRPTDSPQAIRTSWDAQQGVAPYPAQQPKKKSKAWLWALGIIGLVVLICGGGFAGFFIFVASQADTNNGTNTKVANNNWNSRANSSTSNNSQVDPSRVQDVELSGWVRTSAYGTTEFKDGELLMAARQKNYYYVLVDGGDYKTDGATTHVTVRNADNADSALGYGLIVHSDTSPLMKDYALLIDSKKQRFRVVRHDAEEETVITPWTNSKLVNEGTAENVLEARDKGAKIELYINGQLASTITNKSGPKGGVPGLYAADGAKIGFKKLEIIK
jgi:hypothetical protein